MDLKRLTRNAQTGERVRKQIQRSGFTMDGKPIWTDAEDKILRALFPDYAVMQKKLKRRSYSACRYRARALGLVTPRQSFKGTDLQWLRKHFPSAPKEDILAKFPDRAWPAIRRFSARHNIHRPEAPPMPSGYAVIDQIKIRARELNYSLSDVDKLARTKRYFQKAGWLAGRINHRAIGRAVMVLFGEVRADWK